jgi:hypothetical protein
VVTVHKCRECEQTFLSWKEFDAHVVRHLQKHLEEYTPKIPEKKTPKYLPIFTGYRALNQSVITSRHPWPFPNSTLHFVIVIISYTYTSYHHLYPCQLTSSQPHLQSINCLGHLSYLSVGQDVVCFAYTYVPINRSGRRYGYKAYRPSCSIFSTSNNISS